MRVLIISAVLGGLVALATVPWTTAVLHAPLCSTVGLGADIKSFCISWDATKGRYETPPAPVPADFGARDRSTVDPTVVAAVLIFVVVTFVLWLALTRLSRVWQTSRARGIGGYS